MTRSNQPKSQAPGRGSTLAQEKIPAVTRVTPASFISCEILGPHLLGPLLGVVVAAEMDAHGSP